MNRMASTLSALVAATTLGGCENDAASYRIGDSGEHALILIREQRYLWDRHSDEEAHADLYRAGRDGLEPMLEDGVD